MVNVENVLVYTMPPTITSGGAILVAIIGARAGKRNEAKLHSIDRAVNGTQPGDASLREEVSAIHDAVTPEQPRS